MSLPAAGHRLEANGLEKHTWIPVWFHRALVCSSTCLFTKWGWDKCISTYKRIKFDPASHHMQKLVQGFVYSLEIECMLRMHKALSSVFGTYEKMLID